MNKISKYLIVAILFTLLVLLLAHTVDYISCKVREYQARKSYIEFMQHHLDNINRN